MKILLLYPGKVWGGAEQYVYDLGHAYMDKGHEVTWYYRNAPALRARLDTDAHAHPLDFKGAYHWGWITKMRDILKRGCPDVVHIHSKNMVAPLMVAKKLADSDARIFLTYHEAHRGGPAPWLRWAFRRLDKMLFVSDFAFRRWHGSNRWMPAERCATIINSVKSNSKSEGISLREKFGIAPTTPLLVFSGRVRKSKGCTTIVEALSKLIDLDWAMVYIGASKPAEYQAQLSALAEKYGIGERVYFTGFTANSLAWVKEADIGLAPSIVIDACPLSPLEFMMYGKCVISSDTGGQPEYITDDITGLIVPPDHPEALAAAIKEMLMHPDRRGEIAQNAKAYFDAHLSYDRFVDRILSFYTAK